MYPSYSQRYDLPTTFLGDTLVFPEVKFSFKDSTAKILSANMQIRNKQGLLISTVALSIKASETELNTLNIDTAGFEVGELLYDIETVITGDIIRTYVYGQVVIVQDITQPIEVPSV